MHIHIEGFRRAWANLEAVVVTDENATFRQTRIKELNAISRRLVQVNVNMDVAKVAIFDLVKALRDPSGMGDDEIAPGI